MLPPHSWHGTGPQPLVLIAGLGAPGSSWKPFLATASEHYRVLTLDNCGAGRAPAAPSGLRIGDMARDLLGLLDALGLARVAVVGRSMGGMIAQELALLAPDRVSRLVLAGTTGRVDRHLAEVFLSWARMAESGVSQAIRHESSMLWCLGGQALDTHGPASHYLRLRSRCDRPLDYARQARACAAHDALDRLGAIRCPTLVMAGADDRLTPLRHARELAAAIPDAAMTAIPGAGHLAYLEAPDRFAARVLTFLDGGATQCPSATTPW